MIWNDYKVQYQISNSKKLFKRPIQKEIGLYFYVLVFQIEMT